jgi:hypothetical protein
LKDGAEIILNDRIKVKSTDVQTTLTISSTDTTDQGKYLLRLKNRAGEDEASIALKVCMIPFNAEFLVIFLCLYQLEDCRRIGI